MSSSISWKKEQIFWPPFIGQQLGNLSLMIISTKENNTFVAKLISRKVWYLCIDMIIYELKTQTQEVWNMYLEDLEGFNFAMFYYEKRNLSFFLSFIHFVLALVFWHEKSWFWVFYVTKVGITISKPALK